MCLLLTLMAAVAATVAWYACEKRGTYRLGTLCLIYWGAGLMWLVDFFFEYFSEGAAYFQQSFSEILNDSLLATLGKPGGITLGELQRTAKNVLRMTLRTKFAGQYKD